MARPIPFEPAPRDHKAELRAGFERAPTDHAAAMLAGLECLQALYDHGVLDFARGLIGSGGEVIEIAAEGAKRPIAVNGLRNLFALANMLGSIDPKALDRITTAIPKAVNSIKPHEKPPGLWALAKGMLFNPDGRRGLGIVAAMMQSIGKNANRDAKEPS